MRLSMMTRLILIISLIFLAMASVAAATAEEEHTEMVSGFYLEDLTPPLFYETVVSVVREFKLPNLDPRSMRIKWPLNYSTKCEDSDKNGVTWAQQSCPIVYHFNRLLAKFSSNMSIWEERKFYAQELPNISFSCDEISNHFGNSPLTEIQFNTYLADLRKCPLGLVLENMSLTNYVDINTTDYETILTKGITEYAHKTYAEISFSTATNFYTSIQGTMLLNFYMHSARWESAVSSCESYKIPYSLISKQEFNLILNEIRGKLSARADRYELAIPLTHSSTFYKLQLTDCAFTSNNSLLVRIQIPIRKFGSDFRLVNLHAIPFVQNYNRSSSMSEIRSIANIEGKYIIENSTNLIIKTACQKNELCKIPDKASMPIIDPCISAIFSNHAVDIAKYCVMKCNYVRSESLPLFRRISPDTYIISGESKSKLNIFIMKDGKPYKVIAPMENGALRVTLPCNYEIVYESEELHSNLPCRDELKFEYIDSIMLRQIKESDELYGSLSLNSDKNDKDNDTSQVSGLIIQLFVLWALVIVMACVLGVLVVKVFRLSQNEIRNREKATANNYEIPFMLNHN